MKRRSMSDRGRLTYTRWATLERRHGRDAHALVAWGHPADLRWESRRAHRRRAMSERAHG